MNYETNMNVAALSAEGETPTPALHVIAAFIYLFRAVIFNYPPGCVRVYGNQGVCLRVQRDRMASCCIEASDGVALSFSGPVPGGLGLHVHFFP